MTIANVQLRLVCCQETDDEQANVQMHGPFQLHELTCSQFAIDHMMNLLIANHLVKSAMHI